MNACWAAAAAGPLRKRPISFLFDINPSNGLHHQPLLPSALQKYAEACRVCRPCYADISLVLIADFVQELYLKELKAYKPAPVKDSDAAGQVFTFSTPKAPKSPEETDLATSLKEYETMAVDVDGQEATTDAAEPVAEDWLVIDDWDAEPQKHH